MWTCVLCFLSQWFLGMECDEDEVDSWVCFKHCLLSFWECHEKPNARKTMWLGLEIKLIKDWIGVMVVLICLCTRELTIVWRRYTYGSCYRSLHPQNLSKSLGTSPEQLPKRLESSNKPCWTFIRTNFHVDYFVIYNHFARWIWIHLPNVWVNFWMSSTF